MRRRLRTCGKAQLCVVGFETHDMFDRFVKPDTTGGEPHFSLHNDHDLLHGLLCVRSLQSRDVSSAPDDPNPVNWRPIWGICKSCITLGTELADGLATRDAVEYHFRAKYVSSLSLQSVEDVTG